LLTLGSFSKISEVAQTLSIYLPKIGLIGLILTKNVLGYILGEFFNHLSGHPACEWKKCFLSFQKLLKIARAVKGKGILNQIFIHPGLIFFNVCTNAVILCLIWIIVYVRLW
jgi:hypothetical protein